MSGWDGYIHNLVQDGTTCQDAVIVGYKQFSVWGASQDGTLRNITAAEVAAIVAQDRSDMFVNGLTIAGQKCSLIRDNTDILDNWIMDLRTKSRNGEPTSNIALGKSESALVIVKGAPEIHGGILNTKCHNMTKYLRTMCM